MNRYTAQVLVCMLVVVIATILLSVTCLTIWQLVLKAGGSYKKYKRWHYVLLAGTPLTLMIYNLLRRVLSEPHTTSLWDYVITPALIAMPFVASLTGLVLASMSEKKQLIRQIEIAIFCLLAAAGSVYCGSSHYCMDGHLRHGSHEQIGPWIVDGVWLFGIAGAAVIGLGGGFPGARTTGVISICFIVLMVLSQDPLRGIVAIPLVPLSIFHIIAVLIELRESKGEQVVDGKPPEAPQPPR